MAIPTPELWQRSGSANLAGRDPGSERASAGEGTLGFRNVRAVNSHRAAALIILSAKGLSPYQNRQERKEEVGRKESTCGEAPAATGSPLATAGEDALCYSLCGVTETRQLHAQPTAEVIPVFRACFPSGNCPSSEPSCQQRARKRQEVSDRGDAGLSGPEALATSHACLLPVLCFRCFLALTLVLDHYHLVIFLYLACIYASHVHIECPCS